MSLVLETCQRLSKPVMSRFFFIYLMFYEFAYFSQVFFGGVVTFDAYKKLNMPAFYYLMNFNDYPSSLVVLFQQLVVNNWWVVVNMFTELCDGYTHLIRLFFVAFWIINVLILMNIMISIVLDLYGNLQPVIAATFKQ